MKPKKGNMLEVRLLGKFEITCDRKPVQITSRAAQSLFAYLILSAGTAHRREKLAAALWPDSLQDTARDKLRRALWQLRKSFLSVSNIQYLSADDLSIAFNSAAEYWLDVAELHKLHTDASADEMIAVLSEYQGELLSGYYDEWVISEREHIHSVFEKKMARLMSLLQEENRWLEILDWGERWIKLGQKPEPAYRALMSAHAAKGDMYKVAAVYERCVKSLKEFGIEPSEQTRALYQRLKSGKDSFETPSSVAAKEKRKESPRTNLPIPLTSFVGREREVEEVTRMLSSKRLLTLTGPGGLGKTRLAIQSSNHVLHKFKDGVWWVELASLKDGLSMTQAVAQVLGVREAPDQPLTESVKNFLHEKQLLLVLDNCEHLIAESAQLAEDLLTHCANLKILTTSREALGLTGEEVWSVPVLSLPTTQSETPIDSLIQYEAIRLFLERASTAKSDFTLSESNSLFVEQVCWRLDGMPLAIELAAARIKMMSVEEIARRLDDRFDFLTAGSRTALPRHQTLRAAIDWSHNLLTEQEQILFRRLAVFAGGFTLDAAEVVCGAGVLNRSEIIDLLGRLVDKSLVVVDGKPELNETRYHLLETIGQYARERLDGSGEMEPARQRHLSFFIGFAEQAEQKLKGRQQFEWLDRLEIEHDNWRAAWDCAIESDAESALRLASALLGFWLMRGNPSEGGEWLAQLLERTRLWGQTTRRAHASFVAGRLAYAQADFAAAQLLLEEALSIARVSGDKKEIATILFWLGRTALRQRDDQTARLFIEEGFVIDQELQDESVREVAFQRLAELAAHDGEYRKAEEYFMKTLVTYRDRGDRFMAGEVLNALGEVARYEGDYKRAGIFYEEALENLRELGRFPPAIPLFNLAWVRLHEGDYPNATALFEESLRLYREYGHKLGMVEECLGGFAAILGMTGKPGEAAWLFGAVESLLEGIGIAGGVEETDQEEYDHYVAAVRAQLDGAAFEKAREEGRAMTLEQAIEFALTETSI
jgi:predicted ATPase/DNA-binding SARP family transcriptional activator/Tfp pilus assembly protein PilF